MAVWFAGMSLSISNLSRVVWLRWHRYMAHTSHQPHQHTITGPQLALLLLAPTLGFGLLAYVAALLQ